MNPAKSSWRQEGNIWGGRRQRKETIRVEYIHAWNGQIPKLINEKLKKQTVSRNCVISYNHIFSSLKSFVKLK